LSGTASPIPFFTDNDVADSVGDFLMASGHSVIRLRDVMVNNSVDPVVAAVCREQGLVLVTHNIRDFRSIVKDHQVTKREVDSLCRVELACRQIQARGRIEEALSLIEFEWGRLSESKSGLRIYVGDSVIRVHR
jgi:predicted nuclease of predicted toxin-antitoxin system